MGQQVVMNGVVQCSFGAAPSTLVVTPENKVMVGGVPAATIMDNVAIKNVMPFGMCSSIANPAVASATTAAQGVLTPMPCVPVTPAPWLPGSVTVLIAGKPALNNSCKLMCQWGGVIQINVPGQLQTNVP
jgi:hypothetical protein